MSLNLYGGQHIYGSTHPVGGFIRGGNTDMQTHRGADYSLKAGLPVLGRDPYTQEPIVVKKGTIMRVETAPNATTKAGAVLDICQSGENPCGVAPRNYYRESYYTQAGGESNQLAKPIRQTQISMPYIAAVNGALSTPGMFLKAGNGGVFTAWTSGSDSLELAVGRLEYIDTRVDPSGWLRYVTDNEGMGWPVEAMFTNSILKDVSRDGTANTAVTTGTLNRLVEGAVVTIGSTPASSLKANTTNTIYYLSYAKVNLQKPVDIIVGGVTLSKTTVEGVWSDGDGYNYRLNPKEGYIVFPTAQATTVTVQATYAYDLDYAAGLDWESGITGLTDGAISGKGAGWRSFFDVAGATGIMEITLF